MRLSAGPTSAPPLTTSCPEGATLAPPPWPNAAVLPGLTPAAASRSTKDSTGGSAAPAPSPPLPGLSPLPAEASALARFLVNASKVAGDIVRGSRGGFAPGVAALAAGSEAFAVVVFPNADIGAYNLPESDFSSMPLCAAVRRQSSLSQAVE